MDTSVLKRRGCPSNVISDNGKNFISQDTGKFITSIGIKWYFNLPQRLVTAVSSNVLFAL